MYPKWHFSMPTGLLNRHHYFLPDISAPMLGLLWVIAELGKWQLCGNELSSLNDGYGLLRDGQVD
jgi:hypothetical protein